MKVPMWLSRKAFIGVIAASGAVVGIMGSVIVAAQGGPGKQPPITDPAQLPPPPYNRFIRPDTGRIEALVWDDRALPAEAKAAAPW